MTRAYLATLLDAAGERATCYRWPDVGCDDCPAVMYLRKRRWQKPGRPDRILVHEPSCPTYRGVIG